MPLSQHFLDILYSDIQNSPFYSVSFDESLNKHLQKGQKDQLVRFWNSENNIAETRYLNSELMGGAKAVQILSTFKKGIEKLESRNLLHISSDGPNVNLLFLELFSEERESDELPPLVQTGTCGLHTVHGSMKAGIKKSDLNIGKILKAVWKLLDETPARRELFEKVTETALYPLPYCGHRWCENEDCARRAELIWPAIINFIKYLQKEPKSKQPQGKSFQILREAIKDPYIPAKLKLVEHIAGKLNKFLRGFQTDQPMVPFLHNTLKEILQSIMSMFIQSDIMKQANTTMKLLKIDTTDKNLHKVDTVDIGMGAKMHIREIKKQANFKQSSLMQFYKGTCNFMSGITSHMIVKSPMKYQIIRFASSLDPSALVNENEVEICKVKFSKLLEKLVYLKQITAKVGDEAMEQYRKLIDHTVPKYKEMFLEFNKFDHRLDLFYSKFLLEEEFKSLWKVFILIFCLFHGQSAIERGFKLNADVSTQNQSKESLIALRIIKDHMQSKNVTATTIPITRDMLKSVKAARMRYTEYQESKRNEKQETEVNLKRKIICEEISDVQKKKKHLQESINDLVKDADKLAYEAEFKMDMKLLADLMIYVKYVHRKKQR